jgi:hypothetical protein
MSQILPYPGFSWSLTQHMGVAAADTAYEFLQAAYVYSGTPDFRTQVAEYLVDQKLLTANQRGDSGRADAWRDYQQLLAEIGLIVSSRFVPKNMVTVTPIGLMWLDGTIGYSELMTTQCLKYQYPNGMKLDIQANLSSELEANDITIPPSRAHLDAIFGVRIKPAVLILRVLLELLHQGKTHSITADECVKILVPIKTNKEWYTAFQNLLSLRQLPNSTRTDTRMKRHIQEWFSFLGYTDLFNIVGSSRDVITLSQTAIDNIEQIRELCNYHELDSSFWIPTSDDRRELGLSWFRHYGTPNINEQWFTLQPSETYISENYPQGIEVDEDEFAHKTAEIRLQPYEPRTPNFQPIPHEVDREAIVRGHESRQQNTRLHEEIVALIATKLQKAGYELLEDPNSVDLLASQNNQEAIIEVKTVTKRNIYARMRLGVGQLSEYRFRRQQQVNARPVGILVLSSGTRFPDWLIDYFETDIKLGLLTLSQLETFMAHTRGDIEKLISKK